MSKIKFQGNASGTGVLTITSPNTNADRTITLPDSTDTLAVNSDVTNKLPLAGGTLTGNLIAGGEIKVGTSDNGKITSTFALTLDPPTGEPIVFRTAGTDIARFNPGGGLCFGTDTAAANALDDYEEGTWTPANQWITLTNNATARYVKIGSLVTVWGNVTWASSPADTSQTGGKIQGLPYTPVAGDFPWLPSHWVNTSTGARKDDSEYDYYLDNSTTMTIYSRPNSRVVQRQQVSGTQMKFTATYTTA